MVVDSLGRACKAWCIFHLTIIIKGQAWLQAISYTWRPYFAALADTTAFMTQGSMMNFLSLLSIVLLTICEIGDSVIAAYNRVGLLKKHRC
jgi:hypothetical protein